MEETKITRSTAPLKLLTKLNKIIREGVTVYKNGNNQHFKYKYVTEADMMDAARLKFAENKLVLTSTVLDIKRPDGYTDITRVNIEYTLTDLDSGEVLIQVYPADGHDKTDKGVFKAYSGSYKYYLMKLLMVAADDDPEKDDVPLKSTGKSEFKRIAKGKDNGTAIPRAGTEVDGTTSNNGNAGDGWD